MVEIKEFERNLGIIVEIFSMEKICQPPRN